MHSVSRSVAWIALLALLLVAALTRAWGLGYDLPYVFHPDEPVNFGVTQRMFVSGSLNPHFFGYPSLLYYVNTITCAGYYLVGRIFQAFHSISDIKPLVELTMGTTWSPQPSLVLLSRSVTVLFGTGTVALTFLLGRQLIRTDIAAFLGALATALAAPNVVLSRLITPDTFATFFAVATVLAATFVMRDGRLRHYVIGGLLAGLAASSKYNVGLIAVSLLVAHLLSEGRRRRWSFLLVAALSCAAGFIVSTPFSLLDLPEFVRDLKFDALVYATGHAGMEGNAFSWYLDYMWRTAGIIYVFAALQMVRGFLLRSRPIILLASFPLIYFVFICGFEVRNDRTLLPLTPFMYVLGAMFVADGAQGTWTFAAKLPRQVRIALFAAGAILAVGQSVAATIAATTQVIAGDSRQRGREWILSNVQPGSRFAIEAYSPFIDPNRYKVAGFVRIIDHELKWYEQNDFQYLVVSQGMYGRFFRERARYPKESAAYETLFARLSPVAVFPDSDYEIRIYRLPVAVKP